MTDAVPCALVVDDDEAIRGILTQILETAGIRVISVADGDLALEQVHFACPDAVLLDVCMSGLGGMDVLAKIRDTDDELPVVFLTGFGDIHQAVEAMRQGAYD